MVSLKFVFNQEKLQKDGENAICVIAMFVPKITRKDAHYMDLLDEWTVDVDGEIEDCI